MLKSGDMAPGPLLATLMLVTTQLATQNIYSYNQGRRLFWL